MLGASDWVCDFHNTIEAFMNLGLVPDVPDFETADCTNLFPLGLIEAMARRVRPGDAHRDVPDASTFPVDAHQRTRLPDRLRDPADHIPGDSPRYLLPVSERVPDDWNDWSEGDRPEGLIDSPPRRRPVKRGRDHSDDSSDESESRGSDEETVRPFRGEGEGFGRPKRVLGVRQGRSMLQTLFERPIRVFNSMSPFMTRFACFGRL
jgi:hypothetical protein